MHAGKQVKKNVTRESKLLQANKLFLSSFLIVKHSSKIKLMSIGWMKNQTKEARHWLEI